MDDETTNKLKTRQYDTPISYDTADGILRAPTCGYYPSNNIAKSPRGMQERIWAGYASLKELAS